MGGGDVDELGNDISAVYLNCRTDFALGHREHFPLEFVGVAKLLNRGALFHQRSLFHLRVVLRCDRLEIFVAYEINCDLLCQVTTLLFGFSRFHDRPDSFFHFLERPLTRVLLSIHLDDVKTELSLDEVADSPDAEAESRFFKFGYHLSVTEIAEVTAAGGRSVFRILFGQASKILAFLGAFKYALSLFFDFCDLFRGLALGFEQDVLSFHALGKRVLILMLVVVLPEFVVRDLYIRTQFQGFEKNVFRFALFRNGVLRFIFLVVVTSFLIADADLVLQFRSINYEIFELRLLVAVSVFFFCILVADVHCGGNKTSQLFGQDFIGDCGLEFLWSQIVLGEDGLIPVSADEGSVFTKNRIFEDLLFDFGRGYIEAQSLGFFCDDVSRDQSIHDLPVKPECFQHLRVDLPAHPLDIISICRLEFSCTDAIVSNRGDIVGDTDRTDVPERDVHDDETGAHNHDENYPDPFQRGVSAPHEIQHKEPSEQFMLAEFSLRNPRNLLLKKWRYRCEKSSMMNKRLGLNP